MDDIVKGILSGVIVIIIVWMTSAGWRRLLLKGPTRSFWKLDTGGKVLIVTSLPQPDPAEYTFNIPLGDAMAYSTIAAFLKHLEQKLEVGIHRRPDTPLSDEDWNRTVVLIGGGKSNLTTRCLLPALNPPLHEHDYEHPEHDSKELKDRGGRAVLNPDCENGQLHVDYGYIIRAPNPYYPDKYVFIFAGSYSHGTYGAAYWATRPKNLLWLWLQSTGGWITDLISRFVLRRARQPSPDSLEVVLRVPLQIPLQMPTKVQPSELKVPSIQEDKIEIWDLPDHKNPCFFRVGTYALGLRRQSD